MSTATRAAALLAAVSLTLPLGAADPAAVDIKPVKLAGLEAAIAKHKGEVVVVDFWADFCVPCKKEFPNLVRLHREHGKAGLAAVSVSVDEPDDGIALANCRKFLQQQGAAFENYLLDESAEAWQKQLGVSTVPAVFVYGRDGKLLKKFSYDDPNNQFTYKDVEAFVVPLVKGGK